MRSRSIAKHREASRSENKSGGENEGENDNENENESYMHVKEGGGSWGRDHDLGISAFEGGGDYYWEST